MKEFEVNKFIKLKLENDKTIIYVNNERFDQCKFLLLNLRKNKIESLEDIESIDEAAEKLDKSAEDFMLGHKNIPPELEFWGHCSNLQVWSELNYNSRLLHRSLAFPLLKKLNDIGDPIAKKFFKEEIAQRFTSGYYNVMKYLIEESYILNFAKEELKIIRNNLLNNIFKLQTNDEIIEIIGELNKKNIIFKFESVAFHPNCPDSLKHDLINNELIGGVLYKDKPYLVINGCLDLTGLGIEDIEDIKKVSTINYLKELRLGNNNLNEKSVKMLGGLDSKGKAISPNKIINYAHLMNYIHSILKSRKKFLWSLNLQNMKIEKITFLNMLRRYDLRTIKLSNNEITEICCLDNFRNLKRLDLNNNKISEIKGLKKLENLIELRLGNNKITEIQGLENLNKLKILEIGKNPITPKLIEKLGGFKPFGSGEVNEPQRFVKYCKDLT